jgi:hypothetical protein
MEKIGRGLSDSFVSDLKNSEILELYNSHKEERFLGIRNDYINLYYQCASIAKISSKNGTIQCSIAEKYLDLQEDKGYRNIPASELVEKYSSIVQNVIKIQEKHLEKKAQQTMVLNNNSNPDSKWFCIDLEYVLQLENKKSDVGRFDIIAISKEKPYRVALIELKFGTTAYKSTQIMDSLDKENIFDKYKEEIKKLSYEKTLGSGILGHIYNFIRYNDGEYYKDYLIGENVMMINSYHKLGIIPPFSDKISKDDFCAAPHFYFITVADINNNAQKSMRKYLFKNEPGKSSYNVEKILGVNLAGPEARILPTFLFSKDDGSNIFDILKSDLYVAGL